MEKAKIHYKIKNFCNKRKATAAYLSQEAGIDPLLAQLYSLRDVEHSYEATLAHRLEPFNSMKGVYEAAVLLYNTLRAGKKICVIADYDVDGATACAIAVLGLRMFGAQVDYVVPNRFIHGYGLQPSVVDEAIEKKSPHVLVTVDNGIASIEGVKYANSKGLQVLITDHHLPGEVLPEAAAIVNPNQPGCAFSSKNMAGCGVIFYVLCALRALMIEQGIYSSKTAPLVFSLLDLVAIGTVADVVRLDLNNRVLVNLGLQQIRSGRTRPGVLALIEVAKKSAHNLTTSDIGFGLGPRLNAAGRLEDMSIGINCLIEGSYERALQMAHTLNSINVRRKEVEQEMKEQALEMPILESLSHSTVVYGETFHEGVIGIVASRLKELFYRPTIVFAPAQEEGVIKGSGRSTPEVNMRDAIDYVYKRRPDIIIKFGGHAMAAGITIHKEKFEEFKAMFDEGVAFLLQGKELINSKEIDLILEHSHINVDTVEKINSSVWGQGFPTPLFVGKFTVLQQKILKDAHLKLTLQSSDDPTPLEGIWFFRSELLEQAEVQLVYTLGVNSFRGETNVQLMIEDIYEKN